MRCEAAAGLNGYGEIVVLLTDLERGMLQNTWDKSAPRWSVGGDERGRCSPEVVQAHGFAEPCGSAGPDNVVDPACR